MAKRDSKRSNLRAVVEAMEHRLCLDGTSQTITINVAENEAITFASGPGEHVDIEFAHCSGTVTVTGTNLVQTTAKHGGMVITGTVTELNKVEVIGSTDPSHADVTVDGIDYGANPGDWMDLQDFVDEVRVNKIDISDVAVTGTVQIDQAISLSLAYAHDARMSVVDTISFFFLRDDRRLQLSRQRLDDDGQRKIVLRNRPWAEQFSDSIAQGSGDSRIHRLYQF